MKDEQNLENGWCLETNFQFFFSDIPKWNVKCTTTTELTEETSSGLKRDKISWNNMGRKWTRLDLELILIHPLIFLPFLSKVGQVVLLRLHSEKMAIHQFTQGMANNLMARMFEEEAGTPCGKKQVESQKKCFLPLTCGFFLDDVLDQQKYYIPPMGGFIVGRCCWWQKSRPPAPPPWWPCHLSSGPKGLLRPSPTHPEEPRGEMGPIFGVWDVGPGYVTYVYSVIFWLYKN